MSKAWGRNFLVLAFTAVCFTAAAQEQPESKTIKSGQDVTPARRAEVKGRLPRHFGSLVNNEQRTEIYLIQAKFREKISKLKQELEKLETQQMQDIEAVLTAEQRKKLNGFRDNSRRKGKSDSPSKDRDRPNDSTSSLLPEESAATSRTTGPLNE